MTCSNPADEAAVAQIDLISGGTKTYTAVNALGQIIAQGTTNGVEGMNEIDLNTSVLEASMYYLTLGINGKQSVQKINVLH